MIHCRQVAATLIALTIAACGGGSTSAGPGGGPSCQSSSDCGGGVCVTAATSSGGSCLPTCSGSASSCGASAECGGVGVSINVCQPTSTAKVVQRVACESDSDCSAITPGSVCATWDGLNGCTAVCTPDSTCQLSIGGVSVTFFSCQKDQGPPDREVCAPREECITNPTSCFSTSIMIPGASGDAGVPMIPGFDASLPGFPKP